MSDSSFGEVIDLSNVAKARRGAEATYEQGLLDLLTAALSKGKAARVTRFAVLRAEYASEEEYRNAKRPARRLSERLSGPSPRLFGNEIRSGHPLHSQAPPDPFRRVPKGRQTRQRGTVWG